MKKVLLLGAWLHLLVGSLNSGPSSKIASNANLRWADLNTIAFQKNHYLNTSHGGEQKLYPLSIAYYEDSPYADIPIRTDVIEFSNDLTNGNFTIYADVKSNSQHAIQVIALNVDFYDVNENIIYPAPGVTTSRILYSGPPASAGTYSSRYSVFYNPNNLFDTTDWGEIPVPSNTVKIIYNCVARYTDGLSSSVIYTVYS